MFDKNIVDCQFNEEYHFIGDFDFVMKVASRNEIDFVNEPLAYNRIHKNNETSKKYILSIHEILRWYKNCEISEIKNNKNFKLVKSAALYNLTKYTLYKKKKIKITKRFNEMTFFQILKIIIHYLKIILKID